MSCEREMSVWSMEMSTPKKVSDPPKKILPSGSIGYTCIRIYMYTSPKLIDREGQEKRHTETRQKFMCTGFAFSGEVF